MSSKKVAYRKVLENIGSRHLIAILISIVLSGVAIFNIGQMLYKSAHNELMLNAEMDVMQSTERFNNYLAADKNALIIAGYSVNNMLMNDAPKKEILRYLTEQTEGLTGAIDKSFTGLYGWVDGEYLDGSGWVPDADYVATERPWYKAAVSDPHEIVFVDPYVDSQTGNVMMTLAELLDDEKSVIALDIGLEGVQKITEEIAADTPGVMSIVIDNAGVAIAHSDKSEVGKNYNEEKGTLGSMLVKALGSKQEDSFEISYNGVNYLVYVKEIEGGWHSVSVIDTAIFYKPLYSVILLTAALAVIAVLLVLFIFYRVSRRELVNKNLAVQIGAIADIYDALIDVNLTDDTYFEINQKDYSGNINMMHQNAQDFMYRKIDQIVDPGMKRVMRDFLNLSTLAARIGNKSTLTTEFLDRKDRWGRGRFIVADRNSMGTVTRALWVTETIDEDKRQKEALRQQAEADRMTGLFNRFSGENRTQTLLDQGRGGMFALFDIDNFKAYNDRYGHTVGDTVILAVAKCLKNSFRSNDIVMRLGGDEFAVFATSIQNREEADKVLSRFFDRMDKVEIKEAEGDKVTVSVGVTFSRDAFTLESAILDSDTISMPQTSITTSFHDLYKAADRSMYNSKRSHDGRVTYSIPEDPTDD